MEHPREQVGTLTSSGVTSVQTQKFASNYGSCGRELNQLAILAELGDPKKLLFDGWIELVPILGPLLLIDIISIFGSLKNGFIMSCTDKAPLIEATCVLTSESVRWFAMCAALLVMILLSWRIIHERAFYVLFRHHILVDFDNGHHLGFYVMIFLIFVFSNAVIHFIVEVEYGGPEPGKNYIKNNHVFVEIFSDPIRVVEDHPALIGILTQITTKYITPASICLLFLLGLDSLEDKLMPLTRYFEKDPSYAYRELGNTLYVQERVLNHIIWNSALFSSNDGPCDIAKLCEELVKKAVKYDGVHMIGNVQNFSPKTQQMTRHYTGDISDMTLFRALYESILIKWWPVRLLLDKELVDSESIKFKRFIGAHFILFLVVLVFGLCKGAKRLHFLLTLQEFRLPRASEVVLSGIFSACCMVFMLVVARKTVKYGLGIFAAVERDMSEP